LIIVDFMINMVRIQTLGFLPDSSEQVEKDKAGMKDRKENVKIRK